MNLNNQILFILLLSGSPGFIFSFGLIWKLFKITCIFKLISTRNHKVIDQLGNKYIIREYD